MCSIYIHCYPFVLCFYYPLCIGFHANLNMYMHLLSNVICSQDTHYRTFMKNNKSISTMLTINNAIHSFGSFRLQQLHASGCHRGKGSKMTRQCLFASWFDRIKQTLHPVQHSCVNALISHTPTFNRNVMIPLGWHEPTYSAINVSLTFSVGIFTVLSESHTRLDWIT